MSSGLFQVFVEIRTGDPRGFNKGRSLKFREGSWVRQTPEEGRRTYRPKRCGNNNKDEDNSPKNLNDKNQQASSQKFWQTKIIFKIEDYLPLFRDRNPVENFWSIFRKIEHQSADKKSIWQAIVIVVKLIADGEIQTLTQSIDDRRMSVILVESSNKFN